jgi:hypothetical protein
MFQECRHILTSGHKCKAAALRGKAYCYYHIASRRYAAGKITQMDPLNFPSIEDAAGVQIALDQVLRALGNWRIEPRHAGVYFYGLQIAARLARKSDQKPSQTVRELSEESAAEESGNQGVAPEKKTCEPPLDCLYCHRRSFCADWGLHQGNAKELLARIRAEEKAREKNPDLETCTPKPFDQ